MISLDSYPYPLVAILRGLPPSEAPAVGDILFEAGFRFLEVPLNRPGAFDAITILKRNAPADAMIGAGTVLTVADVDAVKDAGGEFMVSPNCEPEVIQRAVSVGMMALPGVCTPTDAFRALAAGAHGIKLFPAEMIPPAAVKALKSVLPDKTHILPVGGITPDNMGKYVDAGADGFGIGGGIYRPDMDLQTIKRSADAFRAARQSLLRAK